MARYTGPRLKRMRSVGVHLPGLGRKSFDRKPYPPGVHGAMRARSKKSDYGKQLVEKQKLRFNYGITENYLRKLMSEAFKSKEQSGPKLLEFLEQRLDNVVFRAGFAPSMQAARQLVRHNHVRVNDRRTNIPSFRVRPGQTITLTDKARKIGMVQHTIENPTLATPAWLSADSEDGKAQMISIPTRETFPFPIEISLIVEFYSR